VIRPRRKGIGTGTPAAASTSAGIRTRCDAARPLRGLCSARHAAGHLPASAGQIVGDSKDRSPARRRASVVGITSPVPADRNGLILTAQNIDACPVSMRDRSDSVWILDQKVPGVPAGGDNRLVAVPHTLTELVAAQVVPGVLFLELVVDQIDLCLPSSMELEALSQHDRVVGRQRSNRSSRRSDSRSPITGKVIARTAKRFAEPGAWEDIGEIKSGVEQRQPVVTVPNPSAPAANPELSAEQEIASIYPQLRNVIAFSDQVEAASWGAVAAAYPAFLR
jgi:hypothetical protein